MLVCNSAHVGESANAGGWGWSVRHGLLGRVLRGLHKLVEESLHALVAGDRGGGQAWIVGASVAWSAQTGGRESAHAGGWG